MALRFGAMQLTLPRMEHESDERHWSFIDEARAAAEPSGQAEILRARLSQLPLEQIAAFDQWFWNRMQVLYSWELWGVGSLAGHDGEEPFLGFRAWVVSLGREAAEAAAKDPDSLAEYIFKGAEALELCHAGRVAYELKAGSELPTATLDLFAEPRGTPMRDSELTTRFPRVAAALTEA